MTISYEYAFFFFGIITLNEHLVEKSWSTALIISLDNSLDNSFRCIIVRWV